MRSTSLMTMRKMPTILMMMAIMTMTTILKTMPMEARRVPIPIHPTATTTKKIMTRGTEHLNHVLRGRSPSLYAYPCATQTILNSNGSNNRRTYRGNASTRSNHDLKALRRCSKSYCAKKTTPLSRKHARVRQRARKAQLPRRPSRAGTCLKA